MIGVDHGILCSRRLVLSGRVEKPAVKKKNIARIELDSDFFREDIAIPLDVRAQKVCSIELLRPEVHRVRAGKNQQAAIFKALRPQREPKRNELGAFESPV